MSSMLRNRGRSLQRSWMPFCCFSVRLTNSMPYGIWPPATSRPFLQRANDSWWPQTCRSHSSQKPSPGRHGRPPAKSGWAGRGDAGCDVCARRRSASGRYREPHRLRFLARSIQIPSWSLARRPGVYNLQAAVRSYRGCAALNRALGPTMAASLLASESPSRRICYWKAGLMPAFAVS